MKRINIIATILLAISTVPLSGMKRKHCEIVPENHQAKDLSGQNSTRDVIDPSVVKKNRLLDDKFSWDELCPEIQLFVLSFIINVEELERALRSKNIDDIRPILRQYAILQSLSRNTANLVDDIFSKRLGGNNIIYLLMRDESLVKKIFLKAAKTGNPCTLKLLQDNGFTGESKNNKKLLFSAIGCKQIEFCKNLIEQKMFLEVKNPDLVYAIILQDKAAIKSLIHLGNGKGELFGKYTETMIAAAVGNLGIFILFPDCDNTVRVPRRLSSYYLTNLQCASRNGSIEIVCFLLGTRNAFDECEYNDYQDRGDALIKAACFGQLEVVRLLLSVDVEVNWTSYDTMPAPLTMACKNGNMQIAELLLAHGADTDIAAGGREFSPLEAACTNGSLELIKLLLNYGAKINGNGHNGILQWTPLIEAAIQGNLEVVKFLVNLGADIHVQVTHGTPLIKAAIWGHLEIVKWFVSQKVNINVKDANGLTAADYAAKKGYTEILTFLLANGATQEVTN